MARLSPTGKMVSNASFAVRPVKVKAPHGGSVMYVEWSDGHKSVFPHDVLRGYCPCAGCQGHSGAIEYRGGGNTEILDISTVGNYAIGITWGDGHNAGIYRYDFLRALCQCPDCVTAGSSPAEQLGAAE